MNVIQQWGRRTIAPITVSYWVSSSFGKSYCNCEESTVPVPQKEEETVKAVSSESSSSLKPSDEKEEYFHNLFPKRQLWKPNKEYPLWYVYLCHDENNFYCT